MTYLTDCNWIEKPYLDSKVNHHPTTPSLFKQTANKILKIRNSILFTIIFVAFAQVCWGQANYFYQSKGSGNWNTSGSSGAWSSCATLVGTYTDATIAPSSTNNVTILSTHEISLNTEGYAKDLTINGTLTVTGGNYILSVYGSFYNNNTFDMGSGTVLMGGSESQNIGGSVSSNFYNLTIANSKTPVTASKNFNVFTGMKINAKCTFNPDASVVIGISRVCPNLNVSGILKITGSDLVSQYKFTSYTFTGGVAEYAGNSAQNINPIAYDILKINNANGCSIQEYDQVFCNDLNIESGTLTVTPLGSLQVNVNTTLGSSECLVIKSSSSTKIGTYIYNTISGSGTVRVERFISKDESWHLYCSPVSNQSIHNFLFNNLDIPTLMNGTTAIGVGMCDYDTSNDRWKLYPEKSSPSNPYFIYINDDLSNLPEFMGGGKGFIVRTIPNATGTATLFAIGTPNTFPIVTSSTIKDGNGWNCLGNPFTSGLDVPTFIGTNQALINQSSFKFLYLWDPNFFGLGIGGYSKVSSGNIPTGQGFFIKSSGTIGYPSFTATMMKSNTGLAFKDAEVQLPLIKIAVVSQELKSATEINFIPNMTKGLDPGYDAGMLKANKDFALYSRLLEDNGVDFMTQCLPDKNFDQYVIPIGIDFKVGGEITFTAETINLPSGCQALLEDRLTKRFTRLDLKDAKYTATVSANTKGTGRFYLHTSDVISGDQEIEKEPFKISKIGNTLYINGEVSDKANFFVYSVNGKQLANFKALSQVQNQFDASGLPAGVYILTCDDQNQKKSTKFVIEN